MILEEDPIELFEQECRRYNEDLRQITMLETRIHELDVRMENLRTVGMDNVIATSRSDNDKRLLKLIDKKDLLKQEIETYKRHVDWVQQTVDRIPSTAYRSLIWMTYVGKYSLSKIAREMDLNYADLIKARRRFLLYALDEETLKKLEEIRSQDAVIA